MKAQDFARARMWRQPFTFYLYMSVIFVPMSWNCLGSASAADGKKIVESLNLQKTAIANLYTLTDWEEYERVKVGDRFSLKRTRWEQTEIYSDDLLRIKLILEGGPFSPNGEKLYDEAEQTYHLYDGEKTVVYQSMPTVSSEGKKPSNKPHSKSVAKKAVEGYRSVIIHDGMFPKPNGPWKLRNPATLQDLAVRLVGDALAENAGENRLKQSETPTSYHIEWETILGKDQRSNRQMATFERKGSDWVFKSLVGFSKSGVITHEMSIEYNTQHQTIWVPVSGRIRQWSQRKSDDEIPLKESRFYVRKTKINDPNFDESVFKLSLEPNTGVSDTRYGVSYRVGAERALDSQLKALADQARAKNDLKSESKRNGRTPRFLGTFFLANFFIGVSLVVYIFRKRLTRLAPSKSAG